MTPPPHLILHSLKLVVYPHGSKPFPKAKHLLSGQLTQVWAESYSNHPLCVSLCVAT